MCADRIVPVCFVICKEGNHKTDIFNNTNIPSDHLVFQHGRFIPICAKCSQGFILEESDKWTYEDCIKITVFFLY